MSKLVAFTNLKGSKPKEDWVKEIREIAKNSEKVFLVQHAKERMLERNVTIQQVYDVLRQGKVAEEPYLDAYDRWRITLEYLSAGKRVRVAVSFIEQGLLVITVIDKGGGKS